MVKPRLVDANIFRKLSNKHSIPDGIVKNFTNNITSNIVLFFDAHKNLILILIIIALILYFLYRLNNKNKKIEPNNIEVNYTREIDIVDDKIVNVKDSIENKDKISNNILNVVKKEINEYDINLNPVDVNNLGGLSSL